MSELVVWRLCASHREPWAFTGEGAARRAGRWNLAGTRVVYCAESRALAAFEVLVNARDTSHLLALTWICIPATVPAALVEKPDRYPDCWRQFPHSGDTRRFGSTWVDEQRSAVLRVPSAVVAGEFNYLLNPGHPDFKAVKIGKPLPFSFDPRLA